MTACWANRRFNKSAMTTTESPAPSASVRLAKRLGIDVSGEGVTTVAGFIQRHNERLPRSGDYAPMDRFVLTVTEDQDDQVLWINVQPASDDEYGGIGMIFGSIVVPDRIDAERVF